MVSHYTPAVVLVDATSLTTKMKGVGRYTWQLCDSLAAHCPSDGQLIVVVFEGNESLVPITGKTTVVGIPYASEFALGMRLLPRLLKKFNASVFIRPADKIGKRTHAKTLTVCHDLNPCIWAVQPPRKLKRKIVDAVWERLRIQAMRHSDVVVCNSEFVRQGVIRQFGISPARTQIGYCGVDPPIYTLAKEADRDTLPWISPGDHYLLAFATGDEREGYDILPSLFAAARRGGYTGKLAIAGTRDRPYRSQLQARFESLGLNSEVIWIPFLGPDQIPQLSALYRFADFYLETSRHEGFGMQLVEAMACGTTCFSSGAGALSEIGGGFPLPLAIGNPDSAGASIAGAWHNGAHDRDNREQVRHACRFDWSQTRRIVSEFAWGT